MEETICPIDAKFSEQVAALLKPPSPREVQEYFVQLVATRQCRGLRVKLNTESGKGVYSDMNFGEGDLVLKDQMLVGIQHSSNKIDCFVCSFCFRFIGSVELQIGRKLYLQDLGVSTNLECDRDSQTLEDCCLTDLSDGEDCSYVENNGNLGECSSSSSKNKITLPKEVLQSLIDGGLKLTYTKEFPLPPVISCPGGCKEAYYCSTSCAEADWNFIHSLLCTGEKSKSICKEALSNFMQHANETNDIFLLAAKVISFTILKYRKMKEAYLEEQKSLATNDSADGGNFSLLFKAWKPISMGYKRRWWDCIALPDDIDSNHEDLFRLEIRDLAFKSLQFLKAAIFDKECAPLFSLEIYGNIIGMFELNNLDLVVASPVEDYFLYIDDLPHSEKTGAEEITQPFLDALGDEYSVCCQGTAFYPLQSCMNHSCHPNAKAFKREEDRDGQAIIVALQPICKGEEVTISYIDENLPFKERRRLLADYGFRCRCQKCLEEEYDQD